ncbi:MAG TPA: MFS transporter [Solirubrobacterales bacterium]|nr:MFS transporter [Solirubrobacterales bacterium]
MAMGGRIDVLGERGYRRLFLGRTTSLIGDGIAPVAIAFAVLDLTGSTTDLGLVLAAHGVPITALVLFGGVVADRVSPRLAMLGADAARAASTGILAALLLAGVAQVWELALLYAVDGAATAFFNPASDAIVPQIVPRERLQQANALLNLSRALGRVLGPALAGVLLALGSPGAALAADAATFTVSAACLLGIRAPRRRPAGEGEPFLVEMREGWHEFSARTWLWVVVLGAAVSNAIYFPVIQVLGPTVAKASLGGSSAWALIMTSMGIGAMLGGALALTIRPRRPLLAGEGSIILLTLPVLLLALPAATVAIAAGALIAGGAGTVAQILYETVWVQHVPTEALSRVAAYDWFGSLALEPIGLALIGPLAAGIGISTTLWIAAAALALCWAAVISVPSVRRLSWGPHRAPRPLLRPVEAGD